MRIDILEPELEDLLEVLLKQQMVLVSQNCLMAILQRLRN